MRIVKAPEKYTLRNGEIACFLAGGCTSYEWREKVLNYLNENCSNLLVVYDPYNPNIEDEKDQIKWEFNNLNKYINKLFIFSCYFDKYTDQPISMYELGRASVLCKEQCLKIGPWHDVMYNEGTICYKINNGFPMVVSVHEEAPKKNDILFQCDLAGVNCQIRTPEQHAEAILYQYKIIKMHMK